MKKKIWIPIIAVIVVLAVLFVPIPQGSYDDGGTREYVALTYKIVDWNRITPDGVYDETKVYFFSDRYKSIDELFELEYQASEDSLSTDEPAKYEFMATVLNVYDGSVLVEAFAEESVNNSSDQYTFSTTKLDYLALVPGDIVKLVYTGIVEESYPAGIEVTKWERVDDLSSYEYTGEWLNKETAEVCNEDLFTDLVITRIYKDCFFARSLFPSAYTIKLNGSVSDDWCVGDQVACSYKNAFEDKETHRLEADLLTIEQSDEELDPYVCYKPVIYLYPQSSTQVEVKLDLDGDFTCTYPEYKDGWNVTAMPDGTLIDENNKHYNYLYWEGETSAQYDFSSGFCVKGEDTAQFLEKALDKLGLNRKEANEFIVYWLPLMQNNEYNVISFQTDAYTDAAKLSVTPTPDTEIRVFMAYYESDSYVDIDEQKLITPERNGFTVVEWGGTQVAH